MSPPSFLLYGIPRSGSTPHYQIIAEYLSRVYGIEGLEEYFDYRQYDITDDGDGLRQTRLDPWREEPSRDAFQALRSERLRLLQKYPGRYFFKLVHVTFSAESFESLVNDYEWIFVERRNLFDHFLSFAISMTLDLWYKPGGLRLPKGSVVAPVSLLSRFQENVFRYQMLKARKNPSRVLFYEDFLENPDPQAVLRRAGFDQPVDLSTLGISEIQNGPDKLSLFKNADELIEAYRASQLNGLYPLRGQ